MVLSKMLLDVKSVRAYALFALGLAMQTLQVVAEEVSEDSLIPNVSMTPLRIGPPVILAIVFLAPHLIVNMDFPIAISKNMKPHEGIQYGFLIYYVAALVCSVLAILVADRPVICFAFEFWSMAFVPGLVYSVITGLAYCERLPDIFTIIPPELPAFTPTWDGTYVQVLESLRQSALPTTFPECVNALKRIIEREANQKVAADDNLVKDLVNHTKDLLERFDSSSQANKDLLDSFLTLGLNWNILLSSSQDFEPIFKSPEVDEAIKKFLAAAAVPAGKKIEFEPGIDLLILAFRFISDIKVQDQVKLLFARIDADCMVFAPTTPVADLRKLMKVLEARKDREFLEVGQCSANISNIKINKYFMDKIETALLDLDRKAFDALADSLKTGNSIITTPDVDGSYNGSTTKTQLTVIIAAIPDTYFTLHQLQDGTTGKTKDLYDKIVAHLGHVEAQVDSFLTASAFDKTKIEPVLANLKQIKFDRISSTAETQMQDLIDRMETKLDTDYNLVKSMRLILKDVDSLLASGKIVPIGAKLKAIYDFHRTLTEGQKGKDMLKLPIKQAIDKLLKKLTTAVNDVKAVKTKIPESANYQQVAELLEVAKAVNTYVQGSDRPPVGYFDGTAATTPIFEGDKADVTAALQALTDHEADLKAADKFKALSIRLKALKQSTDFKSIADALVAAKPLIATVPVVGTQPKANAAHVQMLTDITALITAITTKIVNIDTKKDTMSAAELREAISLNDGLQGAKTLKIKDFKTAHAGEDLLFDLSKVVAAINVCHVPVTGAATVLDTLTKDPAVTPKKLYDAVKGALGLVPHDIILETAKDPTGNDIKKAYAALFKAIHDADAKFVALTHAAVTEAQAPVKKQVCQAIWTAFGSQFSPISGTKFMTIPSVDFMCKNMNTVEIEANR